SFILTMCLHLLSLLFPYTTLFRSFNTPSLIASLATEHGMLPKWIGKKNKHDAPYVGIIFTAVLSGALATQSYLFLVSCTVLASLDRKSTRLNSSHVSISYAVFCLK